MARYYFAAEVKGFLSTDDVGEELPSLQEAEAHASVVACELSRNAVYSVTVLVLGEDGTVLSTVAAPLALHASGPIGHC